MIAAEGGSAVAVSYDVTSSAQCAALVEDAVSRWGRLDCLDNNVGIGSKGTVVEETEENWARVMRGSLTGQPQNLYFDPNYALERTR